MPRALVVGLLFVLLTGTARAHDFAFTDVSLRVPGDGTFGVDVTCDLDALALGVDSAADSAALAAEIARRPAAQQEPFHFSALLNDRRKVIASYWADGPNTETPPGHWNLVAQFVSSRDGHTLDQDVKMFFALGNAQLDASISVWECKRHFDFARPITAIRFLYGRRRVLAWGGPFQGTRLIRGQDFRPCIGTPPFAEYVSGHSTFSAAAAQILKSVTGSDAFGASVTIPAGASPVEPGAVPSRPVTLSWATFSQAADQAGISRRYGGIHFESGDLEARSLGRAIGARVWARARSFFDGTAVP